MEQFSWFMEAIPIVNHWVKLETGQKQKEGGLYLTGKFIRGIFSDTIWITPYWFF